MNVFKDVYSLTFLSFSATALASLLLMRVILLLCALFRLGFHTMFLKFTRFTGAQLEARFADRVYRFSLLL